MQRGADPRPSQRCRWNQDLMHQFKAALEKNPDADLLSLGPKSYTRRHEIAQYKHMSYVASYNHRTFYDLRDKLDKDLEMNIVDAIDVVYVRKITRITIPPPPPEPVTPEEPPDYRERFDDVDNAVVGHPLSEEVESLLNKHTTSDLPNAYDQSERELALRLGKVLWCSERLWQSHVRGIVVERSDNIVAKVIKGHRDYTEYTSIQFLDRLLPEITAPKPHGLIAFGPFRVLFMSYIPGISLAQAWPTLSDDGKLAVQQQLDSILCRLRAVVQEDGKCLGGVQGEGAKDLRVSERFTFEDITNPPEFSDLQFSVKHHGSKSYIKPLRSIVEEHGDPRRYSGKGFTHGDLHPTNIIVRYDGDDQERCTVTGIIDCEDSGFYPVWHECTTLTRTMHVVEDNDWWNYLPASVSPTKYSIRWLVDLV